MAGSRLEKIGTVFTRVRDLMRSGVMKPHEKPVWFDVYAAFPPKRDPLFVKPASRPNAGPKRQDSVPEIFYAEDAIRAKFYEVYGAGPRSLDLSRSNFVSVSQRFVEQYEEIKSSTDLDADTLFEETGKRLLAQGVVLRRRGAVAGVPESKESVPERKESVLDLKLSDMLAEQQSPDTEEETTSTNSTLQTTV
ncbi:small ribosomal subunit protein mS23 isoform X1 [Eucyclogobius newberryi]|uniref:small ribosomal subunit protein mS23 isoform X1 n=1 Tax=Eucyclogobius newberryi TaxID=166745 RepID=UPI003B5AD7A4